MKNCTLEIRDEVNVRFLNLDPTTRRKLKEKVEFVLPHARHTPAFKLGRWDGKVSFCDVGGRTYLNLLDRLLPVLVQAGYEVEIDDRRPPVDIKLTPISADTFSTITWPKNHPVAGQPVILREYQVECINRFFSNTQSIQQIATGAGKTLITAALSKTVEPLGKSIVIVPNRDLVEQTERDYINLGLDVGVIFGGRKEYNHSHTICTWQSLSVMDKNSHTHRHKIAVKDNYQGDGCWCCGAATDQDHDTTCPWEYGGIAEWCSGIVAVIVDETHKAKADVLKDLLTGPLAHVPIRWGLTGTVPKAEYEYLACISGIGPVVGQLSSKELQDMDVLANLDIKMLQLNDGVRIFKSYAQELNWLCSDAVRLKYIGEIIESLEGTGNTLILVDRIKTGKALVEMYPEWVFLSGSTKSTTRQAQYDEVSHMDNKMLVATYGIAAVGINVPRIRNLVLFEPGKSFVRVIQSIGRSIRRAEDKDFANVIDISSNLKYSKRHATQRKAFYREQEFPFKMVKVDYLNQ